MRGRRVRSRGSPSTGGFVAKGTGVCDICYHLVKRDGKAAHACVCVLLVVFVQLVAALRTVPARHLTSHQEARKRVITLPGR